MCLAPSTLRSLFARLRETNDPLASNNFVDMNAARICAPAAPSFFPLKSASVMVVSMVTVPPSSQPSLPSTPPLKINLDNDPLDAQKEDVTSCHGCPEKVHVETQKGSLPADTRNEETYEVPMPLYLLVSSPATSNRTPFGPNPQPDTSNAVIALCVVGICMVTGEREGVRNRASPTSGIRRP